MGRRAWGREELVSVWMERGIPQVPREGASQQPYKEMRGCGDSQGHLFGVLGAWASAQGCRITPSPCQHLPCCPSLAPGASLPSQPQTGAFHPFPKPHKLIFLFFFFNISLSYIRMRKFGPVTKFLTKWLRNRAIAFCSIPQLPKELRQGTGLPEPPQLPRAEQHEPFLGSPGARQAFEDLLFFFFFHKQRGCI